MNSQPHLRLAAELASHPAVAAAEVTSAGRLVAFVVPDEARAPVVHRACRLTAAGALDDLLLHEAAGRLLVAQVNRTETEFLYQELFEEDSYLRQGIGLPDHPVVVDVGANIGIFSLLVALRWPGARILAVEAAPELAHAAAVNAELYDADITVVPTGLGARSGEAYFTYYPNNTVMSGIYADASQDRQTLRSYLQARPESPSAADIDRLVADRMEAERRRCRLTTLTEVLATHRVGRIDLLKIDVEKAEADVLAGMDAQTWATVDQIVLEVHDLAGRLAVVVEQLAAAGFAVASDQPSRLARTDCHHVYARRPSARPSTLGVPPDFGPTMAGLTAELRAFVADRRTGLPMPDEIIWVSELDHHAAPAQPPAEATGPGRDVLSAAWVDLFGPGSDRPDADFFDLGADSLMSVRLLAKIESALGEDIIQPGVIFKTSRFDDLAKAIDAAVEAMGDACRPGDQLKG